MSHDDILDKDVVTRVQFLLDPSGFEKICQLSPIYGPELLKHLFHLTRNYCYYVYKTKQYYSQSLPLNTQSLPTQDLIPIPVNSQ